MRSVFCGREKEMQQLKDAWEKVSNKESPQPQLVVLLAESGLGKTRVAQEFYNWLSTTHDNTKPKGYWPDDLGQEENNLRVNPKPDNCQNEEPFPYLWWGLRLADPGERNAITSGSAIHTYQKILTPHLQGVYHKVETKQRAIGAGKALGNAAFDIGLSFIPAGTILGPLKTAVTAVAELAGLAKDQYQDSQMLSTRELDKKDNKSVQNLLMEALSGLFDMQCPVCILIDDAQFSSCDPTLTNFTETLLNTAWQKQWPLLLIVTHWEKEWHEDRESKQVSIATTILQHQQSNDKGWLPQKLSPVDNLTPMLKQALSGLTDEQQTALLQRAGGNPRYLDEIIRLCERRNRYFEERNQQNALTKKGLNECLEKSLHLHDLIEDRLDDAPIEVKQAISLASLQGERFITGLIEEMAEDLQFKDMLQGLQQAERPHSFINGVEEDIAEFTQRIFHEVAQETLEDIVDSEEAQDLLRKALGERMDNITALESLPLEEQEMTYRLCINLFKQAESEQERNYVARALARLIGIESDRYDYAAAFIFSEVFMEGRERGLWDLTNVPFHEQRYLIKVLLTMEKLSQGQSLSKEMVQVAKKINDQRKTLGSRQNLSTSYYIQGVIEESLLERGVALLSFQKSHDIRKQLADEFNTPELWSAVSDTYRCLGKAAEQSGDFDVAREAYKNSLIICEKIVDEINTVGSFNNLSNSYDRLAEISDNHDTALTYFQKSLDIREHLVQEYNTIEFCTSLSDTYNSLGAMEKEYGEYEAALLAFQKSLAVQEELARKIKTPDTQNLLSISYENLGELLEQSGDYEAAFLSFQKSLTIYEWLAEKIKSPDSYLALLLSYDKVAQLAADHMDNRVAISYYAKGLEIAQIFKNKENWFDGGGFSSNLGRDDLEDFVLGFEDCIEYLSKS